MPDQLFVNKQLVYPKSQDQKGAFEPRLSNTKMGYLDHGNALAPLA